MARTDVLSSSCRGTLQCVTLSDESEVAERAGEAAPPAPEPLFVRVVTACAGSTVRATLHMPAPEPMFMRCCTSLCHSHCSCQTLSDESEVVERVNAVVPTCAIVTVHACCHSMRQSHHSCGVMLDESEVAEHAGEVVTACAEVTVRV